MRKLLFLLLIIPAVSYSQYDDWVKAFQKSIPAELGTPIHLPEMDYNPDFDINKIASYDVKQRVLVVVSDSLYKKIFSRYVFTKVSLESFKDKSDWSYHVMMAHLVDSLPVIDFSKKELVMYSACGQCLAFCHHYKGYTNCHRNACDFMVAWFIRDKMIDDKFRGKN